MAVDPTALDSVRSYLAKVTDEHGRTGYTRAGEHSSRNMRNAKRFPPQHGEAMTAAGLWCRQALGETLDEDSQLPLGVDLLLAKPPVWEPADGKVDLCYWFFGSEALRRAGGDGDDRRHRQQRHQAHVIDRKECILAFGGPDMNGPLNGHERDFILLPPFPWIGGGHDRADRRSGCGHDLGCRLGRRRERGERDREDTAAPLVVGDADRATMEFGDSLGDREAQAVTAPLPLLLGSLGEAVEHGGQPIGRDAR